MYLIDKTYFIKNINVPNTEEHNSDNSQQLDLSIDKYARQFLQLTLGNVLFSDLDSNVTDGELDLGAPQKWLNLVNGCNYVLDGVTYTWQGLKFEQGLFKTSILAFYTYLNHYQNDINTSLGQIMLEPKNGININPTEHLVSIWNEFVVMYQGNSCNNPQQYYHNGVLFIDYYKNKENGYVSYIQFLLDNKIDYPDAPAPVLSFKNQLGV